MTTFKAISVEDYKKLLDNRQHTYAKTFKNVELLQKFKGRKYRNDINDIINKEKEIEKVLLRYCLTNTLEGPD